MTREQAIQYVLETEDSDDPPEAELKEVFRALYDREADSYDRQQGLWSLCCAFPEDAMYRNVYFEHLRHQEPNDA